MQYMTILDELRGINNYPIPVDVIVGVCRKRGIDGMQTATVGTHDNAYRLAEADLLMWLSRAPNVSQGGQSYTFSEDQRREFRNAAEAVFDELEAADGAKPVYGYKGSRM